MNEFGVSIADAIDYLRAELEEATQRGADRSVRFELGPVKLCLDVSVTRSVDARAGVRFWVINTDAGVGAERSQSHRLEVELRPVIRGVANPLIAAEYVEGS